MKRLSVATALLLSACSSGPPDGACWPSSANTYDGGIGCQPARTFEMCLQTNFTSESCSDACAASDYALTCKGAEAVVGPDGGMEVAVVNVDPDASLGCRVLPIPTPIGTAIYCCPCGGG